MSAPTTPQLRLSIIAAARRAERLAVQAAARGGVYLERFRAEVHRERATIALSEHDPGAAAEQLARAVALDGRNAWTWLRLARARRDANRLADGIIAAQQAVALRPHFTEALGFLVEAEARLGHGARAVRWAAQFGQRPTHRPAELDRVLLALVSINRFDPALALLSAQRPVDRIGALDRLSQRRPIRGLALRTLHAMRSGTDAEHTLFAEAIRRKALPPAVVAAEIATLRRAGGIKGAARIAERAAAAYPASSMLSRLASQLSGAESMLIQGYPLRDPEPAERIVPAAGRVLYLAHFSLPRHTAGYATRTQGLVSAARARGWDVEVVTRLGYPTDLKGGDTEESVDELEIVDGVPYHRMPAPRGAYPTTAFVEYIAAYVAALEPLVHRNRPSILHAASSHWNGLAATDAGVRYGLPTVYEVRGLWEVTRASREPAWDGSDQYQLFAQLEATAARRADRVIVITEALRTEMIARGVPGNRIVVVPNAVDPSRFAGQSPDDALRRELGLDGKTVVGYVGSLVDYEGLDVLIAAVDILRRRRDDIAVLIVGGGAAARDLNAMVRDRGLDDVVRLTGLVPPDDVARYYSLIDIAPFPRLPLPVCQMVSPLKPFEAMAMGKAVVGSDVAALAEIVDDGVTGRQFAAGDAGELARVLSELADDPEQTRRLGAAGREWVRAERTWGHVAGRLDEVYAELADRGPGPIPDLSVSASASSAM